MTEKPEIIVETAPNQTTEEKLALLRENGVTRVSIGVQSFLDSELLTMGRRHRAAQAEKALELMKQTGFDCVNLDLIYGVPGQTKESFLFSVAKAVSFVAPGAVSVPSVCAEGSFHGRGNCRRGTGLQSLL